MKKTIMTILLAILVLFPSKADASEELVQILAAGYYKNEQGQDLAPKVYEDDYYWYDEEFKEWILMNDNLEPDENSERDYMLKNKDNLSELDQMYLDYLNAKALDYTYEILHVLMKNIVRIDDMMDKVPPNNKELDLTRHFFINLLQWNLNEADKYPPIG